MTRLEANKEILKFLNDFLEKHPELRFWQLIDIVRNDELVDLFFEESEKSLSHIKQILDSYDK